jgi:cyclohexanone monooxygenase
MMGRAAFISECTPGYYNNEGVMDPALARLACYFGPAPDMFAILRTWREADAFEGLEATYAREAEREPQPA